MKDNFPLIALLYEGMNTNKQTKKIGSNQIAILFLILGLLSCFAPPQISILLFVVGFLALIIVGNFSAIKKIGAKKYLFGLNPFRVVGVEFTQGENIITKCGLALSAGALVSFWLRIIFKL